MVGKRPNNKTKTRSKKNKNKNKNKKTNKHFFQNKEIEI
jgi:hypothetical protein